MTLLISNDNIQEAIAQKQLPSDTVIEAIEEAYRALAAGKAAYAPRRGVSIPVSEKHHHEGFEDERFVFGTMEGGVETTGYFAIRLKLDVTYRLHDHETGVNTHEKYCMEPGRYCGLILLVDANTAEPLALLNDGVVQHLRVAATNALAARYMAREGASRLGIFGSGGMARSHAEMFSRVHPLANIKVYSPTRAHRELFASEMKDELQISVEAVDSPERLAEGCDMLAACTDSNVPVITASSLQPGVFITCVTSREVDETAVDRIDAVVLHQTVSSSTLATYATGLDRIAPNGEIDPVLGPPNMAYATGSKLRGTLAQLVTGQIPGRESREETNYFYNNIGSGLQFSAIAGRAYEIVRRMGTAREIPTEWLTQSIRD